MVILTRCAAPSRILFTMLVGLDVGQIYGAEMITILNTVIGFTPTADAFGTLTARTRNLWPMLGIIGGLTGFLLLAPCFLIIVYNPQPGMNFVPATVGTHTTIGIPNAFPATYRGGPYLYQLTMPGNAAYTHHVIKLGPVNE